MHGCFATDADALKDANIKPQSWYILSATALASACAAHVAQLAVLPRFAGALPWSLVWPHSLHLWLLEPLAWLLTVVAWSGPRWHPRMLAWWVGCSAGQRTTALAVLLGVTQIFLCLGFWLTWPHDVASLGWLRAFFYLGAEFSPASAFATLQFWLAAWFGWRLYRQSGQMTWLFATVVCLYMGADEWFAIHEIIGRSAQSHSLVEQSMTVLTRAGYGAYSWQMAFVPVIVGVGIVLLISFRAAVSPGEWWILIVGAVVFLGGAFGAESRQARGTRSVVDWWSQPEANANLLLEEGLEMLGVTIVLLVLSRRCWFSERTSAHNVG